MPERIGGIKAWRLPSSQPQSRLQTEGLQLLGPEHPAVYHQCGPGQAQDQILTLACIKLCAFTFECSCSLALFASSQLVKTETCNEVALPFPSKCLHFITHSPTAGRNESVYQWFKSNEIDGNLLQVLQVPATASKDADMHMHSSWLASSRLQLVCQPACLMPAWCMAGSIPSIAAFNHWSVLYASFSTSG